MSKIRLVALFAVLMLVLSACASGGGTQETPGVGTPGLIGTPGAMETPLGTAEGGVPVTGETPMATEGEATGAVPTEAATTEAATTEPPATEAATTEPAETGSPEVEDGTGTPGAGGVPVTGAGGLDDAYPNTVSEVSNYVIVDQNCEQVASIDGHLVSVGDGQILYLVASPTGPLEVDGRLLIPWNALDVNLEAAAAGGAEDMSQQTPGVGGLETPGTGGIAQTPGGLGTPDAVATEMLGGTGTPEAGGTPGAGGQAGACAVFDEGQAFVMNVGVDQVSSAPVIPDNEDLNQFVGNEGWDDEIRTFWSDLGVEVNEPMSGGSAGDGIVVQQTGTPGAGGDLQGTGTPGAEGTEMTPSQVGDVVFLESPGDLAVRNLEDEDVASVEDLILDPESGQISHILLSAGGFLGIGDRFVPVPWQALDFEMDGEQLVLVVDADQIRLEEAPGFESLDEFPSTQEEGWESEFDSYWESGM